MINEELINQNKKIYRYMADEKSRYIFKERLIYSMTGEIEHLKNIIKTNEEGVRLCEILENEDEVYVFGAGLYGKEIMEVWSDRLKGFLDNDKKKWGKEICQGGLRIFSPAEIIHKGFSGKVLICSRLYHKDIKEQLLDLGMEERNIINLEIIFEKLIGEQYFSLEDMELEAEEVFVDAGCLDGMTTLHFFSGESNSYKAYCFEPDNNNIVKCKKNLEEYINNGSVQVIEKGLWSSDMTLYFSMEGNGTSSVSDSGEKIEVVALDNVLGNQKCTFIKMDIEGSEREALLGAAETIRKQKPKLAISIYHKPEDILTLPKLIMELNPDYKLYLRHYSLTMTETVLYAI